MAKDPAMLWYWSDWHSGTTLMSRFLKGCYMDILHAEFNHGHLSLEEIKTVLGSDFGSTWPTLQKKFKQADTGLFFNERLELEKERRKNFVSSRSNGKSGRKLSYDKSHDNHMNNHTENVNENEIDFLKGGAGEKLLVPEMFNIFKKHLPAYPGDQFKDFQPLMDIAVFICKQLNARGQPTVNASLVLAEWEKISAWIAKDNFYSTKALKSISTHIQEIFQKKVNGTNKSNTGKARTGRSATAYAAVDSLMSDIENLPR